MKLPNHFGSAGSSVVRSPQEENHFGVLKLMAPLQREASRATGGFHGTRGVKIMYHGEARSEGNDDYPILF